MKDRQAQSGRSKKVTVKFFIHQAVQPTVERRTKRYPLYMLITYDRKNTMLRCHYGQRYKDLKEIEKVSYSGLLEMEERLIRRTIAYEMIQRGGDFDLKGIHKKYAVYARGIHLVLDQYLKTQLWSILSRLEPYEFSRALNFTDPDVAFDTLYKIARKLYKDLADKLPRNFDQEIEMYQTFMKLYQGSFFQYRFPTIIEWLDGSAKDDYREKLNALYPESSPIVKTSIEFIEAQVRAVLE